MNILSQVLKAFMPLILKFFIYQTGKSVGKTEKENEFLEIENNYWREMHEKFNKFKEIEKHDYTDNVDDLINRL